MACENGTGIENLTAACEAFGVGEPILPPTAVLGGYLHRVWHLTTTTGQYALKQLLPHRLTGRDVYEAIGAAEQLGLLAHESGIHTILPLSCKEGLLFGIGKDRYMMFPWVEGVILRYQDITPAHVKRMGKLLASIHGLSSESIGLHRIPRFTKDSKQWVRYAHEMVTLGRMDRDGIATIVDELVTWHTDYLNACLQYQEDWVCTHGDLRPLNILWTDAKTPVVFDWELAGYYDRRCDVWGVAINWAGIKTGRMDLNLLKEFIDAYRQENHQEIVIDESTKHFGYASWLAWLDCLFTRMLTQGPSGDAVEIERQFFETITAMRYLHAFDVATV